MTYRPADQVQCTFPLIYERLREMTAYPTPDLPPPPPSPLHPPVTPQEARAQAKAAKAHAKAMRPWFRKKRYWVLGLVAVIVAISVASSQGETKVELNTPALTGVDKGIGSQDASADVKVVGLGDKDVLGFREPELLITNNSSKRSNYIIELSLESPDGKTQYDSTIATASNVEPGQSTGGSVIAFTKTGPAAGTVEAPVVKVKSVSRTAA